VPFGHSIEDQDGILQRHDSAPRFERMLGGETALGKTLARLGVAVDVLNVLRGQIDPPAPAARPYSRGKENRENEAGSSSSIPPYWTQIVSGTFSCDILDYLARDAYFTGLKLAVDPRVTSYFKIDRASGNLYIDLAKHELLREDILSEVVRMLEARYYFSERVYYHHAKVSAGALIARAVGIALATGAVREGDLYEATDESVLDLLERSVTKKEEKIREGVRSAVRRFRARELPKRACVFPRYENEAVQQALVESFFSTGGSAARAESEARISDLVRFATGKRVETIVYCPAQRMQLKEARMHVRWPGASEVKPLSTFAERVPRLADLERSYRDLWKFYVFADTSDPEVLAKVREAAQEEFREATNAYDASGRK